MISIITWGEDQRRTERVIESIKKW